MKNARLAISLGVLMIVLSSWLLAGARAADEKSSDKPMTVIMKSLSFDPKKLVVHVGDSVAWNNESRTTHTATSDDDGTSFDTGEVKQGKSSKSVKFEKEGEFEYHCKVHGKTMSGIIVVKSAKKN